MVEDNREDFEKWITGAHELSVERYPTDNPECPWGGQYQDTTVQIAWEAWVEVSYKI